MWRAASSHSLKLHWESSICTCVFNWKRSDDNYCFAQRNLWRKNWKLFTRQNDNDNDTITNNHNNKKKIDKLDRNASWVCDSLDFHVNLPFTKTKTHNFAQKKSVVADYDITSTAQAAQSTVLSRANRLYVGKRISYYILRRLRLFGKRAREAERRRAQCWSKSILYFFALFLYVVSFSTWFFTHWSVEYIYFA